jgi:hypothetical protein
MKRIALLLLLSFGAALAEEGEEGDESAEAKPEKKETPPPQPGDVQKVLTELQAANAAKDAAKLGALQKPLTDLGRSLKSGAEADLLADELSKSLGIFREDDLRDKIVKTLGELRSKRSAAALKRIAGKKTKSDREEAQVADALDALAMAADPGEVEYIAEFMKERSIPIAKAACGAYKHYGAAKARTRKAIAEHLMKRLEAEYPSSGGQSSAKVSAEQQKRWGELSAAIIPSLQAVCREATINDAPTWREWWKENKKKPWRDSES